MYAIQQQNLETKWYDKRKGIEGINLEEYYGLIVNQWQPPFLWVFRPLSRHWFAIKRINGVYYNLDSKLDRPQPFASEEDVRKFLKKTVFDAIGSHSNESQLILVNQPQSNNNNNNNNINNNNNNNNNLNDYSFSPINNDN